MSQDSEITQSHVQAGFELLKRSRISRDRRLALEGGGPERHAARPSGTANRNRSESSHAFWSEWPLGLLHTGRQVESCTLAQGERRTRILNCLVLLAFALPILNGRFPWASVWPMARSGGSPLRRPGPNGLDRWE